MQNFLGRHMSERELLKLGAILARRGYEIVSTIATGGYARVFKVRSLRYDAIFAAKVFGLSGQSIQVASFSSETALLKTLIHPNIVLVYDYFCENSLMIIILEYCEGGNVGEMIVDGYGIDRRNLRSLLHGVVSAFKYLHKEKVAHRDIKPANILLDVYGRPKVADFGLSQRLDNKVSRVLRFGGSMPFAAPEIIKRESYNPFGADVWSLGVTMFLMATGNLPWPMDNIQAMHNAIVNGEYNLSAVEDQELAVVIRACLQVDPERRSTMGQISEMAYFQNMAPPRWDPGSKDGRSIDLKSLRPPTVKSMVMGRRQSASRGTRRLVASGLSLVSSKL